jgi:hypothetical protein
MDEVGPADSPAEPSAGTVPAERAVCTADRTHSVDAEETGSGGHLDSRPHLRGRGIPDPRDDLPRLVGLIA